MCNCFVSGRRTNNTLEARLASMLMRTCAGQRHQRRRQPQQSGSVHHTASPPFDSHSPPCGQTEFTRGRTCFVCCCFCLLLNLLEDQLLVFCFRHLLFVSPTPALMSCLCVPMLALASTSTNTQWGQNVKLGPSVCPT